MGKTIIIGAGGQIGTELTLALRNQYTTDQIIAADIKEVAPTLIQDGPYVQMDILNRDAVRSILLIIKLKRYIFSRHCSQQPQKKTLISRGN